MAPELYQSSHITPEWIERTWTKLSCNIDIPDPLKEFLTKLRERNVELVQQAA